MPALLFEHFVAGKLSICWSHFLLITDFFPGARSMEKSLMSGPEAVRAKQLPAVAGPLPGNRAALSGPLEFCLEPF